MTARTIVAEQTYRGATIQTQANGYIAVIINGQRKGGLVSLEEAQAYVLDALTEISIENRNLSQAW